MLKHLFLCRHADTREAEYGQQDIDRTLTTQGIIEARDAGHWIKNFSLPIEEIHFSAAARTTATASIIAQELTIPATQMFSHSTLYLATASKMLKFLNQLDAALSSIVLMGHNPGISELVCLLQQGQRYFVPTGGVTYFKFNTNDWQAVEWSDIKLYLNY